MYFCFCLWHFSTFDGISEMFNWWYDFYFLQYNLDLVVAALSGCLSKVAAGRPRLLYSTSWRQLTKPMGRDLKSDTWISAESLSGSARWSWIPCRQGIIQRRLLIFGCKLQMDSPQQELGTEFVECSTGDHDVGSDPAESCDHWPWAVTWSGCWLQQLATSAGVKPIS